MKKKQIYETEDGQTFEKREEAIQHERSIKSDKSMRAFLLKFLNLKKSELTGAESSGDLLYNAAAEKQGSTSQLEPGMMSSLLLETMQAHPTEASQALKGTFSSHTPRKRAAKNTTAAKKSMAKKESLSDSDPGESVAAVEQNETSLSASPTSPKEDVGLPLPPPPPA